MKLELHAALYRRYLRTHRRDPAAWLALDDDATLFHAWCENLILCPAGFRETEVPVELRRRTVERPPEIKRPIRWQHPERFVPEPGCARRS